MDGIRKKIICFLFFASFVLLSYVSAMAEVSYTVRKGDSLYLIAKKFKVDIKTLKEINNIRNVKRLRPGSKLLLARKPDENAVSVEKGKSIVEEIEALKEDPEVQSRDIKEQLMLIAKLMLDIPYRFGGSSMRGLDCSAFVQKAFNFIDIILPRAAREQFKIGEPVSKEELSIGDLVFFRTYARFPSHVGIYIGDNLFIHASSKDKKVTIDSLDAPYYIRRFIGAKRLLFESSEEAKPVRQAEDFLAS